MSGTSRGAYKGWETRRRKLDRPGYVTQKMRPSQLTERELRRDWMFAANWPLHAPGLERRAGALQRELTRRADMQLRKNAKRR